MILLALPGSAMGAGMSISGPATVSEGAGVARYTVQCGDTGGETPGLPDLPGPDLPLPDLPDLPGIPDLPGPGLPRALLAVIPNTGTLNVAVADGPAPATQPNDHGPPSQNRLVCSPSIPAFTIDVAIVNDTLDEQDEKFTITASGALVAEGPVSQSVTTTITDDDLVTNIGSGLPIVSLQKTVSLKEKDGKALFPVSLASPATQRIVVSWQTMNWTANSGDYGKGQGTLVFQPGERTKTISVDLKNDRRDEPDEAFGVVLQNPTAATLGQKGAFGLIADDDGPKVKIGKPRVRGKRLVAKVTCPKSADGCKGRLVGKAGKLKLGRKAFNLDGGDKKKLRLKMSKPALKELAEHALRAKLKAIAKDQSGDRRRVTRKARLKQQG